MCLGRVFCASVLAAITLSSIGCGVREQWPTRRFAREYKPTDEGPVVYAPDVQQSTYNRTALSGLPAHVQVSFRHEHPDAAVTHVEQVPTGAGLMLYRVAYMEDGAAGSAMYRAGGSELNPSNSGPTIIRGDLTGRPPAKYGPSTQPTQAGIEILAPASPE